MYRSRLCGGNDIFLYGKACFIGHSSFFILYLFKANVNKKRNESSDSRG